MVEVTPYLTVEQAQVFFNDRLNTYAWDNASDPERLKALKESTRRIDRLDYLGEKLDPDQVLEFPRDHQTEVPNAIEEACCLIALALLDGADMTIEDQNLSVVTQAFSNARTTYETSVRRDYIRHGIPSPEAWQCLLPYLSDGREIQIHRV
jgi:hypothetical protein